MRFSKIDLVGGGKPGSAKAPAGIETGSKVQLRPESFADYYSQARQFFIRQTPPEQRHIIMALTFELSKVETLAIRGSMPWRFSRLRREWKIC